MKKNNIEIFRIGKTKNLFNYEKKSFNQRANFKSKAWLLSLIHI